MKKTRPLILIDIDGVCNAFDAPLYRLPEHQYRARAMGYTVVLDRRHPEWFAELAKRGDIRWATMWQQTAATYFAPVAGFGHDWDFVDFDRHHDVRGRMRGLGVVGYKWPGILDAVRADQPLVYVDDDMDPAHHEWAKMRSSMGVPTLFVQPDPEHGLTRRQYEQIIDFLDAATVLAPAELSVA